MVGRRHCVGVKFCNVECCRNTELGGTCLPPQLSCITSTGGRHGDAKLSVRTVQVFQATVIDKLGLKQPIFSCLSENKLRL